MKANRRNIMLLLGLLVSAVVGMGGCSSSSSSPATGNDAESTEVHAGPVLENVTARIYTGKSMDSIVRATKGHMDLNTMQGVLQKPALSFYQEGKWTGDMKGDSALLFMQDRPEMKASKNDMIVRGNVTYGDKDGTMTVPEIRYYSRTGKLVSGGGPFEKRMKMSGGQYVCTGSHFETDRDLRSFVAYDAHLKMTSDTPSSATEPKR